MRIGFDATALPPRPAGAAVYTLEIISALAEFDRANEYVVFVRGGALDKVPERNPAFRLERVGVPTRPLRLAWEQLGLPRALERLGVDVLHSPHHTSPVRSARFRRVVTVHDLTFHILPQRYPWLRRQYFRAVTRLAARRADAVIVPSRAVRDDVIRLLQLPAERVTTVHEAPGAALRPPEPSEVARVRARYRLEQPYVLSVGSLEPGKNRAVLIEALTALRRRGLPQKLVVAGQRAWRYEGETDLVRRLGLEGDVLYLGYVPPADLPALYGGADLFAFPSLYEGFGLPALEAMACGTPVVASDRGALPEVVSDAGVLVDPYDVAALTAAMARVLEDAGLRADLRERGLRRAAEFSWARAARETLAVYERVAGAGATPSAKRGTPAGAGR